MMLHQNFKQINMKDFFVAAEFPKTPRQIVSPCRVRISSFNHLDFARNSFELCPTNTAKIENRNRKPKWGRHFVPTQMYSPQRILNLQGFAAPPVGPRLPIQL